MSRRFRGQVRRSKQQPGTDRHVSSLGIRFGYWPCLGAPFVCIDIGTRRYELWWGDPSYLKQ